MKTYTKKILSLFLAVVMCCLTAIPVFAEDEGIVRSCPKIHIHGMMEENIYVNPDDPDSEKAWPPSQDRILNAVKQAAIPLAKCAADKDFDKLGNALSPILDELFAPLQCDYNGEIANTTGVRFEYPAPESLTKDAALDFEYDWRIDPIVSASQLNDFINYITEQTGSEQVTIECHSLGGVVTATYLKLYGNSKIKSVVFNAPAVFGETYTGELLKGDLQINTDGLIGYLSYLSKSMEYGELLPLALTVLDGAGVLDFVEEYANELINGVYDEIIGSVFKLFANWPTIWSMVPDADLDAAKAYVFGVYDNAGIDYSGLKEKIDAYNNDIRPYREETLVNTAKTSNLYVFARYGSTSLPITSSWSILSDGIVDVKFGSFGATAAPYGETLSVPDSEYVSPDKTVDASTCLFPEQTWFIKDLQHSNMTWRIYEFAETLMYYDGTATVDTFENYPRFLRFDAQNDIILIDDDASQSFFEKLLAVFTKILNFIKMFLAKAVK